ncbi:MAG: type VII secretion integral membrane protein EccD [Dermatophilaceae bacterium]|jgi:type VII secretion integral membrane protein EccD|nr:type VII secretion integral membrane protein EccD [Actinomycetales bacterium]MBP9917249.1 type VII secretion integral membrane protein EccD [Dermatophilaceae bacterium]
MSELASRLAGAVGTVSGDADLIRLSVAAGDRVTDLVLPSRLPIVEVLPDVAAVVGALDAYLAHGGYSLVMPDGRTLSPDSSFVAQGVQDGSLLSLVNGADLEAPKVYDDVVEAVADAVDTSSAAWTDVSARATTLAVCGLLFALGAFALVLQRSGGIIVPVVAGAAAGLLLLAGALFARGRSDEVVATVVLAGATAYAAVAAFTAIPGDAVTSPLLGAGLAMTAAGAAATFLLPKRGWSFLPSLVLGGTAAVIGGTLTVTRVDPRAVVAIVTVAAVLLGSLIPWVALSSARALPAAAPAETAFDTDVPPIDPADVSRRITHAHQVTLGLGLSVAILLSVCAPAVVGLGWAGLGLVWAAGLALMMRTRQALRSSDVIVGLAGGTTAIVSGTIAGVLSRPAWGGPIAAAVAVLAVAVLATLAVPRRTTVRWGRLLDVAESTALFVLIPLLVVAVGLLDVVRR